MPVVKPRVWAPAALLALCLSAVQAADTPILKDKAREYLGLRQSWRATTLTPAQMAGAHSSWRGKTVELFGCVIGRTNTQTAQAASPVSVMLTVPGSADSFMVEAPEDSPLLAVDAVVHILADLPEAARPTDHFVLRAVIAEEDLPAAERRYAAAVAAAEQAANVNHRPTAQSPLTPSADKSTKPLAPAADALSTPTQPVTPPQQPVTVNRPGTEAPKQLSGPQLVPSAAKSVSAWKQWVGKCNPKLTDQQLEVIVRSVLYYSAYFGLDHRLSFAMIKCESDFNPKCLSSAGAMGLCQLMPFNAKDYGVDPWDLEQNIRGGLNELSDHLKKYASRSNYEQCILGLACYNAGPGAVKRAGHAVPNITETQRYVKKVGDLFYQLWKSGMP